MSQALRNPYLELFRASNPTPGPHSTRAQAEQMVRHLGMLYNCIGTAIKDVTKVMSLSSMPGVQKQLDGVEVEKEFFDEIIHKKGQAEDVGLELESEPLDILEGLESRMEEQLPADQPPLGQPDPREPANEDKEQENLILSSQSQEEPDNKQDQYVFVEPEIKNQEQSSVCNNGDKDQCVYILDDD